MEQSLFIQWVKKYFPGIVVKVVEKLNDKNQTTLTYMFKTMLRKEYSTNGKWEAISALNSRVAADVVAMDSELPLKKRDSISKATGDVPKLGMELYLNENQLTELDTLVAQTGGSNSATIIKQVVVKLFEDTPRCIEGVYERLELMFLEGLSSGVTITNDAKNVGTGIRLDYGYLDANKFGVTVLWAGNTTAKPFDDIQRVLDKARQDGNAIVKTMLDRATFNAIAATTQAKELYAFASGFVGSNVPIPSISQLNTAVKDRFGFIFEIVERSVKVEKNGVRTNINPWTDGAVIFLTQDEVGKLVWSSLAEMNHPVAGVEYQRADEYILVSKYRNNKPSLSEYTSSQARVVPVITGVESIYLIDSKTVQA